MVRTYGFLGLLVVGSVLAVLYLAGCFTQKIGPGKTASLLAHEIPLARTVGCTNGSNGWDYRCAITLKRGAPLSIDVDVDGSGITSQSAP